MFANYLSPFSWRYGSPEMRQLFSEENKFKLWRKIWVALAQAQQQAGLVSAKELEDLEKNQNNINIERILEIEKEVEHDVVAAIREFAEKAEVGGGKIHLGATSYDIVDNADALLIKDGLSLVENRIKTILRLLAEKTRQYADFPCIGYTHLQPAEPTTVGYRLAFYAQDLLIALESLRFARMMLKGKGFKGAAGTAASYQMLLAGTKLTADELEKQVMKDLGIEAVLISNQVFPRQFHFMVLNALVGVTTALAKFAGDLRILQSPLFGEWSEPFGKKQVGSSAMPFKKNPINAENICSLARYVAALPIIASGNASLSYLERTLDDSANKRLFIPEAFLATDQILITAEKIISGLVINEKKISYNLAQYAPFAATELILVAAVKNGADRQKTHEVLREISMRAWAVIQEGKSNPMATSLTENSHLKKYLTKQKISTLLDVQKYVGTAPERALKLVEIINKLS